MSGTNAWAGSNHWKFGKRKAHGATNSEAKQSSAPKSKARKDALVVDFLAEDKEAAVKLALPKLLKKGSKATPITELTAAALTKYEKHSFMLPEDAGVKPSDLGKLFLRPHRRSLRRVAAASSYMGLSNDYDDGVCDDSFGDDNGAGGLYEEQEEDAQPTVNSFKPFNMDDDVDESRMLAPERKVAKISVHHEVRAKRVDVRELKHQIWNDISSLCDEQEAKGEEESSVTTATREFSDVMGSVAHTNDIEGISLPFYFICVLHLANEKGLKLEGNPDLSNFTISADQ